MLKMIGWAPEQICLCCFYCPIIKWDCQVLHLQLPHDLLHAHNMWAAYFLIALSALSVPHFVPSAPFRCVSAECLLCGYTIRSLSGVCLVYYFVLSPTEQRKKYSNSNYIMQETSQYHVEVRSAFYVTLVAQRNMDYLSTLNSCLMLLV